MYRFATIRAAGAKGKAIRGVIMRRGARLGETQCTVDPVTNSRVCSDVLVLPSGASLQNVVTPQTTADQISMMPRASRPSRLDIINSQAVAAANAAAVANTPATAAAPPATDIFSSLSTSLSDSLASLQQSTWITGIPNWALLLAAGAGAYVLMNHQSSPVRRRRSY